MSVHSSTGWTHLLAHCLAGLSGWVLRSPALCTTWLRELRLGAKEGVGENTGNFPITTFLLSLSVGDAEIARSSVFSSNAHDFEPWVQTGLKRQ